MMLFTKYNVPHKMNMHQLAESTEYFGIGLIYNHLWNFI